MLMYQGMCTLIHKYFHILFHFILWLTTTSVFAYDNPMQVGEPIKRDFRPPHLRNDGAEKREPSKKDDSKVTKKKKLVIFGVVTLVIVLLAGAAGFFYWKYTDLRANPDSVNQETTQRLITKVGGLYELPDEEPTVAQISDKEKLKDQPFFKSAQNGDYLLIYTNAKLAVLYREEANKLVNVGPIAISDEDADGTEPAEGEE